MANDIFNIGSFNVLNLVSPGRKFYGNREYSRHEFERKTSWIASQIETMDADILGLQEVFHTEALEEVLKKSNKFKYANYVVAAPDGQLPRVALVTNYEILEQEVIELIPSPLDFEGIIIPITKFSRPVLRTRVRVRPDLVLTIFVVHLKSKRPVYMDGEGREDPVHLAKGQTRALIRRAVEATGLRQILMDSLKNRNEPVVLIGDVNDNGLAVTTRTISGEPPHRNYPREVKKKIWDVLLYHVKDIQARRSYHDFYYTHIHNAHHEALDHIMVSQEFVPEYPEHIGRVGQVRIYNDHLIDETMTDEGVREWQSDHGQVVVSIELNDKE